MTGSAHSEVDLHIKTRFFSVITIETNDIQYTHCRMNKKKIEATTKDKFKRGACEGMLGSERPQRQEIFGVWIEIVEGFFNCIAAEGHMSVGPIRFSKKFGRRRLCQI